MTDPRIPTPDPGGPSATEGAGVVSSWADIAGAVTSERPDAGEISFAAAGAGLDTLGLVADPFASLAAAGIGWLFEHISFLSEPLDKLAGDPEPIITAARTWHDIADALHSTAADHRAAAVVPGWDGEAAQSYRAAVDVLAREMVTAATCTAELSTLILRTGAAVGTVRSLVRDAIADAIASFVQYVLSAAATAFLTAGGSLAVLVAAVVAQSVQVATAIARRIAQLLQTLADAGAAAAQLVHLVHTATARARAAAPRIRIGAPEIIETGKQFATTMNEPQEWTPPR